MPCLDGSMSASLGDRVGDLSLSSKPFNFKMESISKITALHLYLQGTNLMRNMKKFLKRPLINKHIFPQINWLDFFF